MFHCTYDLFRQTSLRKEATRIFQFPLRQDIVKLLLSDMGNVRLGLRGSLQLPHIPKYCVSEAR